MAVTTKNDMKYRFLGNSGLLVSVFSYGCFTFANGDENDEAFPILKRTYEHGINFWDTAEGYGASEQVTGRALQRGIDEGVWTREDVVISTKIFVGTKQGPNATGISRKHLVEGMKASLQRLDTSYVDVVSCHRPEVFTPIEEVVRGMNFIIDQGWAFYWGTSEWDKNDIIEACEIADRLGLVRPIVEQPQYNLFTRSTVEVEYQALYKKYKLGLTTYSPLAFGILTGKYAAGVPTDSRLAEELYRNIFSTAIGDADELVAKVEKLRPIAAELGCSLAQLALAWCATSENVSTVLLGAKTLAQLEENLKAWPVVAKLTPTIKQLIEEIIPFADKAPTRDAYYTQRGKYL